MAACTTSAWIVSRGCQRLKGMTASSVVIKKRIPCQPRPCGISLCCSGWGLCVRFSTAYSASVQMCVFAVNFQQIGGAGRLSVPAQPRRLAQAWSL